MRCNAIDNRTGTDWGCDRDGDPNLTSGCGWYVEVMHAGNVLTRYCHMNTEPMVKLGDTVSAGQALGVVGSTGHSSGPHLHFEIRLNAGKDDSGVPADPVSFIQERLAPLGK